MALALNNLKRVDMPLNKETKSIHINMYAYSHMSVNVALNLLLGWFRGIVANELDCEVIIYEFKPQLCYYVLLYTGVKNILVF